MTQSLQATRGRRFSVNITGPERVGRIALGLEVLLVLAGLDLVVTGALGHRPLYRKLGYVPQSLRRPT